MVRMLLQSRRNADAVKLPNIARGDHKNLTRSGWNKFRQTRERAALHQGFIGSLWSLHAKTGHDGCTSSCSTRW